MCVWGIWKHSHTLKKRALLLNHPELWQVVGGGGWCGFNLRALPLAWEPITSLARVIFPMTSSWLKEKDKRGKSTVNRRKIKSYCSSGVWGWRTGGCERLPVRRRSSTVADVWTKITNQRQRINFRLPDGVLVHDVDRERVEPHGQVQRVLFTPKGIKVLPHRGRPGKKKKQSGV